MLLSVGVNLSELIHLYRPLTFKRKDEYSSAASTSITPFFVLNTYTVLICDNIFSNVNSRCGLTYEVPK